jgi:pimeloyl-ACP methyl ester carboxylesterase
MSRPEELLKRLAGPDAEIREQQREAITDLVEDRARVLCVQRTGWGKSAVYFLATSLLRETGAGPALIVSPLLALMRNQIAAAERLGIRAHTINSTNRAAWDERTLSIFADSFTEPARARAAVQMYRTFQLREVLPLARGRYAGERVSVPTRFLFGEDDPALRPPLLAGADRHIDDVEIELVPETGHFIVDERPDLVVERARAIFAPS